MFGLLGRTVKNLGKNAVVGSYNAGKKATGFIGDALETAKYEATQEQLANFEEQLAFLSQEEKTAVLELAKQKRLEAMAESKAKLVVTNLQLTSKRATKGGDIDPATLKALAAILQSAK